MSAQEPCPGGVWTSPTGTGSIGVQKILKDLPITTKWADLPEATKSRLQELAEDRLAAYRARWSADALAKKQTILLECPTPEMTEAIDDFYRKIYDTVVSKDFSINDLKSESLSRVAVRHYLGTIADRRSSLHYPNAKLPNRDWDGESLFDSTQLPDQQANTDIGRFNAEIVADLRGIEESSLNDLEEALRQKMLFDARASANGVFDGFGYGGVAVDTPCGRIDGLWPILAAYQLDKGKNKKERPQIFATDDEVLREMNAIYLNNTELRWLDRGTLSSALHPICNMELDGLVERVGDPAKNEVAKGITLLKNWWIERVSATQDASKKCTIYSIADRNKIWDGFSAGLLFNNDGSTSMETYRDRLQSHVEKMRAEYRDAAMSALNRVFPNDELLTSEQRQQVAAMIDSETGFGLFTEKIADALDAVQGTTNGRAEQQWRRAINSTVKKVGGNYNKGDPVRAEDEAAIQSMFEDVKSWLAGQYQGYPIDIEFLYSHIPLEVTTGDFPFVESGGKVTMGVGTARSKMEYYSWLIHEMRHAVRAAWQANAPDPSQVATDDGPVNEGSGVAAEALLLPTFLKQVLNDDTAFALYVLDYGIRDARFAGTTDATLQKYFRGGCSAASDPDTIEFSKSIAESYGLTGELAETAANRANANTQYFQYIWGGLQVLDEIDNLQRQIDPSGQRRIDPFVLFFCGLNTPRRDTEYVTELKACFMR